jgi:hypothetical protein
MIEALILTAVASIIDWPTYTDTQWIHTDDWSARIEVNYYEDMNYFEYEILNAWWSIDDIDYFQVGHITIENMDLQPGHHTTYELTSFGGYEDGTGFISSIDYGEYFGVIVPVSVPSLGSLAVLGVAGVCATRRRR